MEVGQFVHCSDTNPFKSVAGDAVGVVTCVSNSDGVETVGVLFETLGVEQGQIPAENYIVLEVP